MGVKPEHNRLAFQIENELKKCSRLGGSVCEPDQHSCMAQIEFVPDALLFDIDGDAFANAGQALRRIGALCIAVAERVEARARKNGRKVSR
jgi:hypothetical protein